MGRFERKGATGVLKNIWYPGNLDDWRRAGISVGAGLAVGVVLWLLFGNTVFSVVVGASVTAGISGLAFGQRDARALANLGELKTPETGKALWRALVKGVGAAFLAVLVAHVTSGSGVSSWVLPLVPAVVAAIAHQVGMVQIRLDQAAKAKAEAAKALFPKKAAPV